MANKDIPNGAVPVNSFGSYFCGSVNEYYVPATDSDAMAVGDFVKPSGTAHTDGTPIVARAAATNTTITGAIVGFRPDSSYLNDTHRTASTARYVLVADDPHQMFSIQEDSVGGAIAVTAVSGNADIVVAAVDTATGLSGMEIDSDGLDTATAQLRIMRLDPKPDNEVGVNANWIVRINEHVHKTTAGV